MKHEFWTIMLKYNNGSLVETNCQIKYDIIARINRFLLLQFFRHQGSRFECKATGYCIQVSSLRFNFSVPRDKRQSQVFGLVLFMSIWNPQNISLTFIIAHQTGQKSSTVTAEGITFTSEIDLWP